LAQVFIDTESVIRDFALLKVEKTGLPFLELGTESEVSPGSDITIIGYPFSAESAYTASINTKFCLSGMVAATDTIVEHGVNINAIYFQGPAVKGISGGPIISRDTGHVVGIQSQKLAGIGVELNDIRKQLVAGKSNMTVRFTGVDLADSLIGIIDVMDRHLVNELGSGTGASDVAYALKKARREYERQHPRK